MVHAESLTAISLPLRALIELAKPRLSFLVIFTAGAGMRLAPIHVVPWRAWLLIAATSLVVGAANALNCYLERDVDARMLRTRGRPLPQGRLSPQVALLAAIAVATAAIGVLYGVGNPLTALLAFIALALYAWVYTPMKQITSAAMLVGAVPGAIPPLMGYTAATGKLDEAGLSLFALLFFWQLPHFLAVSCSLKEDYARGGIVVLPNRCSARATVLWTLGSALVLLPVSLWPRRAGLGGDAYVAIACLLGCFFCAVTAAGLHPRADLRRWSRRVFVVSIFYLAALLTALVGSHG